MQAGTSHDLGDNFARAFGTQFLNEAGDLVHPQQSSWGASTRLVGGIIMAHGALLLRAPRSCHARGRTESEAQLQDSMRCSCWASVTPRSALTHCVRFHLYSASYTCSAL